VSLVRRPRSLKRALLFLAAMTLVSAAARGLWSNGVFSSVPTGFLGSCKVLAHLPGVQDMEVANGLVFISAAGARGPSARDGIYLLPLSGGSVTRLPGAPRDFHPRGLSVYRTPDGRNLFLLAVNRRSNSSSIDSFEIANPATAPALVPEGTIQGGLLTNPQDVAATGPGTFFVANEAVAGNFLLRLARTYGLLAGGNLLYFNGTSFVQAADGLYAPRSLMLTRDGMHLVASGLLNRSLTTFNVEPFTAALTEAGSLTLPTGPERLSLDGPGNLWVAGHARLAPWRAFATDPHRPSPSQVLRIGMASGMPQQAGQVYGNDGSEIGGASVAISAGKRLLIGSSLDGRLLDCTQK
jgi:arylesterase/paraoxonase